MTTNHTASHTAHQRADHDHAPHGHDHHSCVATALSRARQICAARDVRLTPQRERVLELVWSSHRPRGAYDILEDLSQDGRRVAPLTVYRALDFLLEQGLVHRIESLNAFVGCADPGHAHAGQFLVCERCGEATELSAPEVSQAIATVAARSGFAVSRQTVEVAGLCPACQGKA
ncbi:Fur family transcriptional regulator [Oleisolibacter albus]|uniref:Fur family transcriptional regulator n=1 Tax=Oleisolibacter albus TaxID=2171757 RepID=UPI000DF407A6|nr:Fur family transcriptional regulator [Oleisolibacter albus]